MDYEKIQSNLLKLKFKDKMQSVRYGFNFDKDVIYVTPDTHVVYVIPLDKFYLEVEKFFKSAPMNFKIIADDSNTKITTLTNEVRVIPENKKNISCYVFQLNDGDKVYVNMDLLKNFPLKECNFRGSNKKSAIYIYHNAKLVGLVLPINVKED